MRLRHDKLAPCSLVLLLLLTSCVVLKGDRPPATVFAERRIASPVFQSATACLEHLGKTRVEPSGSFRSLLVLASWNAQKSTGADWRSDLQYLADSADILLLQEAAFVPAVGEILPYRFIAVAEGYHSSTGPTGVMSASHVNPRASCSFIDTEPLLQTRKASSVTRYPLSNHPDTLLVANVHSINFSLGLGSFKRQLTRLAIVLHAHEGPIIFAGDFNTWNASRTRAVNEVAESLGLNEVEFTPDSRKRLFGYPLDRTYSRGLSLIKASSKTLDSSDHNALVSVWGIKIIVDCD